MQEPLSRIDRRPVTGEEVAWPTERHQVPTAGEIEFDDTVRLPDRLNRVTRWLVSARWAVAEINENTRIAIKAGSVFGVLLVIFGVGVWYGDLRSERARDVHDKAAQQKVDDRQDAAITQLQATAKSMDTTLQLIKQSQDKDMPQLIRQSTYSMEVLRDIEVALASKGIMTKSHGP